MLKGEDKGIVDRVKISASQEQSSYEKLDVTLRFNRNPIIGDKFSSRHGQKGVLSYLWPEEDLPFIERNGIKPDIIINPHAFPSRMTIGMLMESLASKEGALSGNFVDASPFKALKEEHLTIPLNNHYERLKDMGYKFTGTETMINGFTGCTFEVDIFIGLVYYQRLRHMVSDKFQVRSEGPNNPLTKQPIKGRKMGGGIRFGEMERDSLLSHGVANLIQDRLLASSDKHSFKICSSCGSMISHLQKVALRNEECSNDICITCRSTSNIVNVHVPYVYKYLISELAAMNIRLCADLND
jgi:DNA-directed RNA polymerase I subunit RPA2